MCQTGKYGTFPIAGEKIDDFRQFVGKLSPIQVTYQAVIAGQDKTKYVNFLSLSVFLSNINYIF